MIKNFTYLNAYCSTAAFFLCLLSVSCTEDTKSNSITLVKSERTRESHPEIVISKKEAISTSAEITKDSYKEITAKHKEKNLTEFTTLSLDLLKNTSSQMNYGMSKNRKEIAESIISRINENKSSQRRPLRIAYFNPRDRKPVTAYQNRIEKIMTELQVFYGKGMERNGFGYRTFDLEKENDRLKIHFVQSNKNKSSFARNSFTSNTIYSSVAEKLKAENVDIEKETVIVFQNLARIENNSFFDTDAPYYGSWNTNKNRKGFCYVVDSEYLDWNKLKEKNKRLKFNGERSMTLGELASGQIGGVCHELGHAFCLNHTHSNHIQNQKHGTALMGYGNWTFKQELRNEGKGTYLSFITATKLMGHPCFSSIQNGSADLQLTDISLQPMNGMLEIGGSTISSPNLYSVIGYCDNLNKRSDYDATGWVGAIDESGNFQISINELEANQSYKLNLQFLFTNGKESTKHLLFKTNSSGAPVIEEASRQKLILKPLILAKLNNDTKTAASLMENLSSKNKDKSISFLKQCLKVMDIKPTLKPFEISQNTEKSYLSITKWDKASTGYNAPKNNGVHKDNHNNPWPFLVSNAQIHRFGLYAHSNSEYSYSVEKKWKNLSGKCSLKKGMKGSVEFIILGDGQELFNSGTVRSDKEVQYDINISEIRQLKLIVTDAGDGKNSDWGQWLSPLLSR